MQRSDIDDQHVIDLAQKWYDRPNKNPGVVAALIGEGVPYDLAMEKVEDLSDRDYLDYGGSAYFAWPTGKKL